MEHGTSVGSAGYSASVESARIVELRHYISLLRANLHECENKDRRYHEVSFVEPYVCKCGWREDRKWYDISK